MKLSRIRKRLRLPDYDYSSEGAYFVTICAHGGECLFGEIENGLMRLNEYGDIVASEWLRSPSRNVGAMVRGFKSAVSRRINEVRNTPGASVWQRNYYEHIIRDDYDLNRIREYIIDNPANWSSDISFIP